MYLSAQHRAMSVTTNDPPVDGWSRCVRVGRNVLFLGLTSMFTDISSEMLTAILPVYLMFELRFTALQFGIFDGVYQGMTALTRMAGGLIADRHRRYKEVAGAGYALSTGCKLGLLAAGGVWMPTTILLFLDRIGKGIRTAPRDALISLSSPRAAIAEAFGVHRTLDTAGALLGPLVAFSLLGLLPGAFDVVFVTSFAMGVIGLGILLLFVDNRVPDADHTPHQLAVSLRSLLGLLRIPRFRALIIAAAALNMLTLSDAFVYLTFQRRSDFDLRLFPLLYLGTSVIYLLLAIPAGRLADYIGRGRVFLGGYVSLLGVYGVLLRPSLGLPEFAGCFLLFGAYYAATDGVLIALASTALPPGFLTSGLALLTTAIALARVLASVMFGASWSWQGPTSTLVLFIIGLSAAMVFAAIVLAVKRTPATP
jgi:MFS family permease